MTGRQPLYTAVGSGWRMVRPATTAVSIVAATRGIHMFTSPTICSDCDPSTVVCRIPTTPTRTNRHKHACSNRNRSSDRSGSNGTLPGNATLRLRRESSSADVATATMESTLAANEAKSGATDTSAHCTTSPPRTWHTPVVASDSAANTSSHAALSTVSAKPHRRPYSAAVAPTGSPVITPVALRKNPTSNAMTAGTWDSLPGRKRPVPTSSKTTKAVTNDAMFIVNMASSSDTNPTLEDTDPIAVI